MERNRFLRTNADYLRLEYSSLAEAEEKYNEFLDGLPTFEMVQQLEIALKGQSWDPDAVSMFTRMVATKFSERVAPLAGRPALYPPQAALLASMLRHESNSWIKAPALSCRSIEASGIVQWNLGRIVERFSFGKTHLIAHLAALQPQPDWERVGRAELRIGAVHHPRATCASNLVIVGRTTVKDWEARGSVLARPAQLDALRRMFAETGALPPLLAIRSGEMTYPDRIGTLRKTTVVNCFLTWFGDLVFSRVFYDDYDCLGLFNSSPVPKALFHWLVSSTDTVPKTWINSADLGKQRTFDLFGSFFQAKALGWLCTTIRCNRAFAAEEFKLPAIAWFRYYVHPQTRDNLIYYVACVKRIVALLPFDPVDPSEDDWCQLASGNSIEGGTIVPVQASPDDPPRLKILLVVRDSEDQQRACDLLAADLGRDRVLRLDRRNAHTFGDKPQIVGVSKPLHGLNMGYLTDIIADCEETVDYVQTIGRGQRLGRTFSLRAYLGDESPSVLGAAVLD